MRQDEVQGAGTTLADFVAATVWADVTAQNHEAKRSILNFFATALGSAYDPVVTAGVANAIAIQRRRDIRDHRPSGTARCDGRGVRQCDFGESSRFRRYPSGHDHSSGSACGRAGVGIGTSERLFGAGRSHGIHSRRGSRMPHRQRGVPRTLCARLAHHLDLRRVRCGCGLCETAWAFGGSDFECDRNRRQPVGRDRRESA